MKNQLSLSPGHALGHAFSLALGGTIGLVSVAHGAGIPTLQEVTVVAGAQDLAGIADSASEGTVTAKQLAGRPLLRPAEVMEAVPGMIVTQHSGDGKANQYFLRGFNLDHGSDFATSVNGAPVNNVSHGHGQGYMDLNFLIPELIGDLRYRKGGYAAEDGDFAVTGSSRISYARSLPAPLLGVDIGENGYRRVLGAASKVVGADAGNDKQLLGAIELTRNDGPWDQPEGLDKQSAVFGLSSGTAQRGYNFTLQAYDADWIATEHVPERAITNGEIGRFGTLAPNDGGKTHRYNFSAEWADSKEASLQRANIYLTDYALNLFSSPSALLDGQHEQADDRITFGGGATQTWLLPQWRDSEFALGLQYREDRIDTLGLYTTVDRRRTATIREDEVEERALGLHGSFRTQWQPWLRSTLGLRWDRLQAEVTPTGGAFNSANGGKVSAHQASPKLGVVIGPFTAASSTEYYANWGRGFHSNDARGATSRINAIDGSSIDPVPLIVRATGGEIGVRTSPLPGWQSSLSLWQVELASELIFIGDEGVTEPKGASKRQGIEWANYYSNNHGLIIDGDLAISHARLKEASNGGRHVPNAIPLTASLAATLDDGGRWFGGIRLRYIDAYPLEETGTQQSSAFWTANLKFGYRVSKSLQFGIDILNLFDRRANDIEYWGASCTATEGPACNGGNGVDGRLLHPLEPRTLRIGARMTF